MKILKMTLIFLLLKPLKLKIFLKWKNNTLVCFLKNTVKTNGSLNTKRILLQVLMNLSSTAKAKLLMLTTATKQVLLFLVSNHTLMDKLRLQKKSKTLKPELNKILQEDIFLSTYMTLMLTVL